MAGPALSDRKPVLGKLEGVLSSTAVVIPLVNLSDDSSSSGDGDDRNSNANNEAVSSFMSGHQFKRSRPPVSQGEINAFAGQEEKKPRILEPKIENRTLVATPSSQNSMEVEWLEDSEQSDLPLDFLEPLSPDVLREGVEGHSPISAEKSDTQAALVPAQHTYPSVASSRSHGSGLKGGCRQFWKAGDYEGQPTLSPTLGGMDHVRVHPKFLHSNATSHKWALGAMAELLDNALDEVPNGATFVNVDMIKSPKDGRPMLFIEDDGGGMDSERMRQCMSLGYSAKTKSANTIGQYGNGFKTSTMRLGADVIVFSRSTGGANGSPCQSVGLLSYTFLRSKGCEDIIVPMVDYDITPFGIQKLLRLSDKEWQDNLEIITEWSPYPTEADLLNQFSGMKDHGTKIIVYNLWEDDEGKLELDFDADPRDIQLRGVNRDEKKIAMAKELPNSRHYLTYQHSLRSYVSILYLRLPKKFRIIMRGKQVEHHNLVDDMIHKEIITYRPQGAMEAQITNTMTKVTVGFVKDAEKHVDVQGFNVYHKNRLIKPFWRIWNSSSSQGRGVIGFLEANFVEPAHDKQGFEKTTVLARLEGRLLHMQKKYWHQNCHLIGYVNNSQKQVKNKMPEATAVNSTVPQAAVPDCTPTAALQPNTLKSIRSPPHLERTGIQSSEKEPSGTLGTERKRTSISNDLLSSANQRFHNKLPSSLEIAANNYVNKQSFERLGHGKHGSLDVDRKEQLACENLQLRERLQKLEDSGNQNLILEIGRNKELQAQVKDMTEQLVKVREERDAVKKECGSLTAALTELRKQRELDDQEMRRNLKVAVARVRELEAENKRLQMIVSPVEKTPKTLDLT
ncbi:hypothetical protein O6H91_12G009100 [Diphasiastrum complanatum]|uniref:Uncharacterized protein n=1 Tax=Diphasiastrum complanatum TaxID=34168 RepID=A0ACC2BYP0_DIPCM|nr:hypothetical protein O6H91_12G009100 [Diphasiastrum complanatum]